METGVIFMKIKFIYSLIQYLIKEKQYELVELNGGVLDGNTRVVRLKANSQNTLFVEIIDTDKFSEIGLIQFLDERTEVIKSLQITNTSLLRAFLFDNTPSEAMLAIINRSQSDHPETNTYLKAISISINDRRVYRHFGETNYFADFYAILEEFLSSRPDELIPFPTKGDNNQEDGLVSSNIQPNKKIPVITYVLIAINILVWILLHFISFISGDSYFSHMVTYGAKVNSLILQGEIWRLLTPVFLHSGITHLAANCYSLFFLGTQAETLYGHKNFAIIYMFSGLMGTIASFAFSSSISVGASGAIFGLMGAMLYFIYRRPVLLRTSLGVNLVVIIIINLVLGFTMSNIDYFGHIGGLIGGFLISGFYFKTVENTPKSSDDSSTLNETRVPKRFLSGTTSLVIAIFTALVGLFYGIYSPINVVFPMLEDLKTYNSEQKWVEAENTAEEILLLNPSDSEIRAETLWGVTIAESMQGKWDEGIDHAKQLTNIDPQSGHYLLGILYFDMAEYASAREELLLSKQAGPAYAEMIDKLISEIDAR